MSGTLTFMDPFPWYWHTWWYQLYRKLFYKIIKFDKLITPMFKSNLDGINKIDIRKILTSNSLKDNCNEKK